MRYQIAQECKVSKPFKVEGFKRKNIIEMREWYLVQDGVSISLKVAHMNVQGVVGAMHCKVSQDGLLLFGAEAMITFGLTCRKAILQYFGRSMEQLVGLRIVELRYEKGGFTPFLKASSPKRDSIFGRVT